MTEEPRGNKEGRAAALPELSAAEPAPAPTPAGQMPAAQSPPHRRAGRQAVVWLAVMLAIVVIGVVAAPFWAPAVLPLLPWRATAVPPPREDAALSARLEALDQRQVAAADATARLLSQQAALAQRLDRLQAGGQQQAATADAVQQLRRDIDRLDTATAKLGDRIGMLEAKSSSQSSAGERTAALLLSLIELREAVAAGHPYAAEYQGFAALARGHSDLQAAAAPLAQGAGTGIATLPALRRELAALAARPAAAASPPREWWRQALVRMQGLVVVRRIGVPNNGRGAAVAAAQTALDGGDLAAAVSAVAALSGADAEAVRPWLQQARARLSAAAALDRLQDLLTAELGAAPTVVPKSAPANGPPAAPTKAGAPS